MNDTNERSCASRGSQPEAWAVEWKGDTRIDRSTVCYTEDAAKRRADECPSLEGVCIPLYRSPTLTDEEREAIRRAIFRCNASAGARRMSGMDDLADEDRKDTETFSGLLKRLG